MAGSKVYGGASNMSVLLQNERLPCSSGVLEPLWIPSSEPSFHGNFLNFWCSLSLAFRPSELLSAPLLCVCCLFFV